MRRVLAITSVLVGGCSTMAPAEPQIPVHGETPGFTCREDGLSRFVGESATAEVGAEILRASGAKTLRWIPEGGVITMDLRADRVNVRLDRQNKIESVDCG